MSFSSDVNDFAVEVGEANEAIVRSTAIALFRDIIFSSPVDTGRFRANWFVTGETPSTQVTENTDKSGISAINTMQSDVLRIFDWSIFSFTNNLPYSEVIEFGGFPTGNIRDIISKVNHQGFSKQSPKGVLRMNTLRFSGLLEKEAAKRRYGNI